MSADRIKNYYLLCTVHNGGKSHMVSGLSNLSVIFTKKEVSLFLQAQGDQYIVREAVVGGGSDRAKTQTKVLCVF